ncbi:5-methyltetrahydropteroyltriglutamate--homocysteine S-methyltransferase [Liquorilactobacillus mali]|uniref:5-methyltetrahydropteroyltriglutamate-- homocysteine S-methyltransferase n=1 Tax=Liquorilactobacillus mali TaxID=1618 RepID=UPI002350085A|nr:5-methyltetrahydropteroyltriglutamate--homocysteine S-methyltransferase [Liquorilactobacillus mali]MDC7952821.1 5-methyltetrahydropteroyltriglutamate--homocysteine S-methyltransferase [Liquorilactobacillus mali]
MLSKVSSFTKPFHSPFRNDIVGSFLRPARLKKARQQFAEDQLTATGLKKVEDELIIDLIKKEEDVGLQAVTDGEFRRSWYHLDFFWGLQGIKKIQTAGWQLHDGTRARGEGAELTGPLGGRNHPFIEHFEFMKDHISTGIEVKQTLPSPALFLTQLEFPNVIDKTKQIYPTEDALIKAIAQAYDEVLADFYKHGAKIVQFDDSAWSNLIAAKIVDHHTNNYNEFTLSELNTLKQKLLKVNNLTIAGAPDGLIINAHICRGNYKSNWAYSGSYANIADPLFTQEKINAFYLEYDSEHDGGFDVLKKISTDKWVVLGLLTSKNGKLEEKEKIMQRIEDASHYFNLDHLCLSPQCGFASSEEGNILTEEQQWAKLRLIKSITAEIWG